MFICAVVSMISVNVRRLLPHNPCTIAGVARFFAHSSILIEEIIPPGSEFLDEKELRKHGILEHGLYSLGYWDGGEKSRFRIDLGRAEGGRGANSNSWVVGKHVAWAKTLCDKVMRQRRFPRIDTVWSEVSGSDRESANGKGENGWVTQSVGPKG